MPAKYERDHKAALLLCLVRCEYIQQMITAHLKNMRNTQKLIKNLFGKVLPDHLVKLDPWYTSSKTCHGCAHKMEAMPLSVRKWDCPSCKVTDIDRDLNAALNIRDKGILELKAPGHSFLLMEAA